MIGEYVSRAVRVTQKFPFVLFPFLFLFLFFRFGFVSTDLSWLSVER